jgi:uncharacterized protein (DUF2164 family)
MGIVLKRETEQRCMASIRRWFAEELGEEVGELKARLALDFFLREIGPSVWNQAVAQAQASLAGKVSDLEGECFQPEFGYWKPGSRGQG